MNTPINEIQTLTETEKMYRINERLEEMYAANYDWANVISRKWSMLYWAQMGGN